MKALVLLLVYFCSVSAHLCLMAPAQRGELSGLNEKASLACFRRDGPCGDNTVPNPLSPVALNSGANFDVIFQKNLNHYHKDGPGNFTIDFATSFDAPEWETLISFPDTDTPSLHIYQTQVTLPNIATDHGLLRVIYYTNAAPGAFYQCADIALISSSPETVTITA